MDLDPSSEDSVWRFKPDDLLVDFAREFLGLTAAIILAALFLVMAWRDGLRTVISAGGLLSDAARTTRSRLQEQPGAQVTMTMVATAVIVIFELLWLFCVFAVGNLMSLVFQQREEEILRFTLVDPLETIEALQWDWVSTVYVLTAVFALAISRRHYREYYGSEFLGATVSAPILLAGAYFTLGVVLQLIVAGLAKMSEGSANLDKDFPTWLLLAGASAAYIGLCILALRTAVFLGNLWLGDPHGVGRLTPASAEQRAYLRAFYQNAKNGHHGNPVRLGRLTKGWQVSSRTTSDDRSSRTERLCVTTAGRPVHVSNYGIEKVDGHLHKFPIDWASPAPVTQRGRNP